MTNVTELHNVATALTKIAVNTVIINIAALNTGNLIVVPTGSPKLLSLLQMLPLMLSLAYELKLNTKRKYLRNVFAVLCPSGPALPACPLTA